MKKGGHETSAYSNTSPAKGIVSERFMEIVSYVDKSQRQSDMFKIKEARESVEKAADLFSRYHKHIEKDEANMLKQDIRNAMEHLRKKASESIMGTISEYMETASMLIDELNELYEPTERENNILQALVELSDASLDVKELEKSGNEYEAYDCQRQIDHAKKECYEFYCALLLENAEIAAQKGSFREVGESLLSAIFRYGQAAEIGSPAPVMCIDDIGKIIENTYQNSRSGPMAYVQRAILKIRCKAASATCGRRGNEDPLVL